MSTGIVGPGQLDADSLADDASVPPAEYYPVSIGAKLLGDRWTLVIIRELMAGAHRFNQVRRGHPGLNRSVLSDRLRHLERAGLIERTGAGGSRPEYTLTEAGHGLEPVIIAIGMWTIDWQFAPPPESHTDICCFGACSRDWTVMPSRTAESVSSFQFPDTHPSRVGSVSTPRRPARASARPTAT